MAEPRVRRPHRAVVLTISLLIVALVGAGCTEGRGGDGEGDSDGDRGGGGGDRTAREISLEVGPGKVAGKLARPRRSRAVRQVGGVVDAWFEAAYVGGDYPRSSFARSWPGFTRDARRQAVADRRLTSNAGMGRSASSVRAVRKRARVDLLAWRGRAHTATARFRLVFDARAEERTRRHRVEGRLMLVRDRKGQWRVIGYDVRRSSKVRGGGRS